MKSLAVWLGLFLSFFPPAALEAAGSSTPPALEVILVPTVQYAHGDRWFRVPSNFEPSFESPTEIAPGQRLDLLLFVRGYALDSAGRAHVTYRFAIQQPGGETIESEPDLLVSDEAPPAPGASLYPKQLGTFKTDAGELPGPRRFTFVVHDHISDATVQKSTVVDVTASNEPLPLPSGFSFDRFIDGYYQSPIPRLAVPALAAFSQGLHAREKPERLGTVVGFYDQLLSDNPWLVPHFIRQLATTTDANERRMFALVLGHARDAYYSVAELPQAARTALAAARAEDSALLSAPPPYVAVDLQWGHFFASGRFAPIAAVIAIAERYAPSTAKAPKTPEPSPAQTRDAATFGAMLWSLGTIAHHHALVRAYLENFAGAVDTTPTARALVRFALDSKSAAGAAR